MRSSKANRIPLFGRVSPAALFGAALLAIAIVCALTACSTAPAKPKTPAGYNADTTPGRDGSEWIGGAP